VSFIISTKKLRVSLNSTEQLFVSKIPRSSWGFRKFHGAVASFIKFHGAVVCFENSTEQLGIS